MVIAGANHYLQIHHAEAFNERVTGFLRPVALAKSQRSDVEALTAQGFETF